MVFLPYLHFGNKNLLDWLGFTPTFGKDSDGEVVTKQLAAVVHVIFTHVKASFHMNS